MSTMTAAPPAEEIEQVWREYKLDPSRKWSEFVDDAAVSRIKIERVAQPLIVRRR